MPDIIDDAQAAESLHLQAALAKAKPWRGPKPLLLDGEHLCASCGDVIPPARQEAMPGVGLCVECQTLAERWGRA